MSARHKMTAEQFAKDFGKLPKRLEGKIIRGLRSAAQRGKGIVVEEIDIADPFPAVDRGELRSSVTVERLPDGARLFVDAPHAVYVEEGARPHYPPLEPLIAWIKRKKLDWISEYMNEHEGAMLANQYGEEEAAKGVARQLQRHIGKYGTKPRWFFRKAMLRLKPIMHEEVRRELGKEGATPQD